MRASRSDSGQMKLFEEPKVDPLTCIHARDVEGMPDKTKCVKKGVLYTNCRVSLAGEPPHCAYEPLDNSPETCARRARWIEEHGK